ncbi:MAG TPA: 30S ribosomal protein S21 [Candidatus Paceibacterota bacterium]|nr:30S ribosomal protein S21 [Candidatus Paceibacterota bacterium]
MLIIKMKEGENIEKALKRFKRKVNETKLIPNLREREQFVKPSVKKREMKKKAVYIQKLRREASE